MNRNIRRAATAALALPLGLGMAALAVPAASAAPGKPAPKPNPVQQLAAKAKVRTTLSAKAAELPPVSWRDCPGVVPAGVNPATAFCMLLITNAGEISMGKIQQPITGTMTMTLLNYTDPATGEDRSKLVKVRAPKMRVPGGALGIPGSDDLVPLLRLDAQTEVDAVDLDLLNMRVGLTMRVKVHNPLLGNNCYIGSKETPVKLNLAIDPTKLEGVDTQPPMLKAVANDNAFAVPAAKGCGLVDPIVNWRASLPSAAGANKATMTSYVVGKPYA
ncbi:hypothetical protein [Actinomadura hibisca]|uniref:hypothetical protein n=1 Tax=Actinomadura hibisca TaxID=68565 RepID=UPI0008325F18|nr:hypothetical protein [Actinomadura hibisca]